MLNFIQVVPYWLEHKVIRYVVTDVGFLNGRLYMDIGIENIEIIFYNPVQRWCGINNNISVNLHRMWFIRSAEFAKDISIDVCTARSSSCDVSLFFLLDKVSGRMYIYSEFIFLTYIFFKCNFTKELSSNILHFTTHKLKISLICAYHDLVPLETLNKPSAQATVFWNSINPSPVVLQSLHTYIELCA